jgi:hypothetical protein
MNSHAPTVNLNTACSSPYHSYDLYYALRPKSVRRGRDSVDALGIRAGVVVFNRA